MEPSGGREVVWGSPARRRRSGSTISGSTTECGCSATSPRRTGSPTCGCCARSTPPAPATTWCCTPPTWRRRSADLAATHPDCPDPADLELPRLLDALVDWGVLDRGQDGARATTLAEYRNRHSVYQFTEAGYRAHRAVESVLAAGLDDSTLSRLVFADLLADLKALAAANAAGDAEEVYRKLNRLDRALADVAERAARFYHMLGDLGRTHDVRPEVFLAHKDALLAHLRDFHDELAAVHATAA